MPDITAIARRVCRLKIELPDPTPFAQQLWGATYDEPWPAGWRVSWNMAPLSAADIEGGDFLLGDCNLSRKVIRLRYAAVLIDSHEDVLIRGPQWRAFRCEYPPAWLFGGVLEVLLHEFTHQRHPRMQHGAKFRRELNNAKRRLTTCRSDCGISQQLVA